MFLFTRPSVRVLVPGLLLTSVLLVVGCASPSPDEHPAIKRKFQLLADQIEDIRTGMDLNSEQLAELRSQVKTVKSSGVSDSALQGEIAQLKAVIRQLEEKLQQLERRATPVAQAAPSRSAAATTAAVKPKATTPRQEPHRKPAGFWHQIKPGEALSSIAAQYNLSESELIRANALPSNARLLPGQQLFIPYKK